MRWTPRGWVLALGVGLCGCEGLISVPTPAPVVASDGGAVDPTDGGEVDAGLGPCTPAQAELERQAGEYLQTTCAHAGCHAPAGPRGPSFAARDLRTLLLHGYVAAGRPDDSPLMARMTTNDPLRAMPPTRRPAAGEPWINPTQVELVRRWIDEGARTGCSDAPPPPPTDVNAQPQNALFTCTAPTPLEPRLRRLGSPEWIHAFGGAELEVALRANPLGDSRGPYSTFARGNSFDVSTLQVYLDAMANARELSAGPVIRDTRAWYYDRLTGSTSFRCLTDPNPAASVNEACRDSFIAEMLARVLSRAPTPGELGAMRAFLDEALTAEPTPEVRQETLRVVYEAAFVLPGALFQPEGVQGQLSGDEFAQLLTGALTPHQANGVVTGYAPRPELGWLAGFRAAQDAGPIDVASMRAQAAAVFALENGYVGGEWPAAPPARPDLQNDWGTARFLPGMARHDLFRARRGRFWLAPRIAAFFREYFDYAKLPSVAKDLPAATSAFDVYDPAVHRLRIARTASEPWPYFVDDAPGTQYEPPYDAQLDDAIARMVVTAERDGRDVFRALFTDRTFRTAASISRDGGFPTGRAVGDCDVELCARRTRPTEARCCTDSSHQCLPYSVEADGGLVGMCGTPTWEAVWLGASFPYSGAPALVDRVEWTGTEQGAAQALTDPVHDARWVTLPANERSGVLTHPAWLGAHGANAENGASAVLRGHWVREHLFCESVAGLDLVQLPAQLGGDPNGSARSRLDATFGANAMELRCSNGSCHALMNPLGLPFEMYNHAGFVRASDHGGAPSGASIIPNWPGRGEVTVRDAVELSQVLGDDPWARRCFLRHVFRYFVGRHETAADACVLASMETAFAGGSLMAALEALYTHDSMLVRATP